MLTSSEIIKHLSLEKHCEGGYFYRTFYSEKEVQTCTQETRSQISSIYYLLTKESSLSFFAENKSDLVLYYHLGSPLKIIFLENNGELTEKILGPNLSAGQQLQIPCPANTCKAYHLEGGEFCLIGEAVAPGFEYKDMYMPTLSDIQKRFPDKVEQIKCYLVD